MSKEKYPRTFSRQMEAIVFSILQIFFAARAVLKIRDYPDVFRRGSRVKWVNFHPPFSEPPSFFLFFLVSQILK